MESKAKILGHAIHPMLIVFPLGLFTVAVVFDIIRLTGASGAWGEAAQYVIVAGIVGGLLAAVFGLVDWLALPARTRAKSVGLWHGGGNVVIVVLFALSALVRLPDPAHPGILAFILALVGVLLATVTGWMGGELDGWRAGAATRCGRRPERGPGRAQLAERTGGCQAGDRGRLRAGTSPAAKALAYRPAGRPGRAASLRASRPSPAPRPAPTSTSLGKCRPR
jgi:uncharacterized membrane protein